MFQLWAQHDQMVEHIQNVFNLWPLGKLWSHSDAHLKCEQPLTSGYIVVTYVGTFKMCSDWAHCGCIMRKNSKCTQLLIAGHIVITYCLCFQCVQHVPTGYLGPCPQ